MRGAALVLLLATAFVAGCGAVPVPPPSAPEEVPIDAGEPDVAPPAPIPPLYTRLGGSGGVAAIIDSFTENVLADRRLKHAFARLGRGAKLAHFKSKLGEQLCEATGGDCHYSGKTMSDAHASLKITGAQFDAFEEDFRLALEEKQVSAEDAKELIGELEMLKDQIVHQQP